MNENTEKMVNMIRDMHPAVVLPKFVRWVNNIQIATFAYCLAVIIQLELNNRIANECYVKIILPSLLISFLLGFYPRFSIEAYGFMNAFGRAFYELFATLDFIEECDKIKLEKIKKLGSSLLSKSTLIIFLIGIIFFINGIVFFVILMYDFLFH